MFRRGDEVEPSTVSVRDESALDCLTEQGEESCGAPEVFELNVAKGRSISPILLARSTSRSAPGFLVFRAFSKRRFPV